MPHEKMMAKDDGSNCCGCFENLVVSCFSSQSRSRIHPLFFPPLIFMEQQSEMTPKYIYHYLISKTQQSETLQNTRLSMPQHQSIRIVAGSSKPFFAILNSNLS